MECAIEPPRCPHQSHGNLERCPRVTHFGQCQLFDVRQIVNVTRIMSDTRQLKVISPPSPVCVVNRVAMIGNFPPRRCGIATFTADLRSALLAARPSLECSVAAMTDLEAG